MLTGSAGLHTNITDFGTPITCRADAVEAMIRVFDRGMKDGHIIVPSGRHDALAIDAAQTFFATNLQRVLESITREPSSTNLMVPGPGQLLPVMQTLDPGDTEVVWDIETPTGEASFVAPDGMRRLQQVGEFSERARHRAAWSGIGWGHGVVELWQSAKRGGRSVMETRSDAAHGTLRRFNERVLLYGDLSHELQGLLSMQRCVVANLGTGFGAITDPDDAYLRLQIIQSVFKRAAESFGGQLDQVIAPETDMFAMQRLRYGADGEGAQFFNEAKEGFGWLNTVRWIDGLERAASTGGSMWLGWANDPGELWTELTPAPMLFGPWTDGLRTSFGLLTHIGGVVNRRPERVVRLELAAA